MKKLTFKLAIVALFAIGFTLGSCGNDKAENSSTTEETIDQNADGSDTYACPMHPKITGEKGDKCSECGMDLTPISGEDHEEHSH